MRTDTSHRKMLVIFLILIFFRKAGLFGVYNIIVYVSVEKKIPMYQYQYHDIFSIGRLCVWYTGLGVPGYDV